MKASLCFELPKTTQAQRGRTNCPVGLIKQQQNNDNTNKHKGSRPSKKLSEKRRYAVLLKLNTIEYFTLKSKATEAGVNKNEYLRALISEGAS